LEVRADEELVEMRTVLSIKERPGVEGILKKSFLVGFECTIYMT